MHNLGSKGFWVSLTKNKFIMKLKLIGLYELITGLFGVVFLALNITKGFSSISLFFQIVFGILLYAGLAYSGNALLNNKKNGIKYSLIAQGVQVISFTLSGFMYRFTASSFFWLDASSKGVKFDHGMKVVDYMITSIASNETTIRFYFIPAILFLILYQTKK